MKKKCVFRSAHSRRSGRQHLSVIPISSPGFLALSKLNKASVVLAALGCVVVALFFSSIASSPALAELALPKPRGYVSDFAGLISPAARESLERRLSDFEKKTGNEIAVVTVENLSGTTIEDYAVRLFENWKIGKKGKDNGVLLLVAKGERKVRIEVGYGLEPLLTDVQASRIIRESISPAFKAGDYDRGFREGVDRIIGTLSGEAARRGESSPEKQPEDIPANAIPGLLSALAFLGFGVVQWLAAVLARTKSWWAGGILGAFLGLIVLIFAGPALGIFAIAVLASLGLVFDYFVSKGYRWSANRKSDPPWWAGGTWGPGGGYFGSNSGDSGGFGGFGGGESGGGGASGDW